MLGDLLWRNDSAPTSGDEDTRFCCEAITTINKGAASTSCATGKKHFIPPTSYFWLPLGRAWSGVMLKSSDLLRFYMGSDNECQWNNNLLKVTAKCSLAKKFTAVASVWSGQRRNPQCAPVTQVLFQTETQKPANSVTADSSKLPLKSSRWLYQ